MDANEKVQVFGSGELYEMGKRKGERQVAGGEKYVGGQVCGGEMREDGLVVACGEPQRGGDGSAGRG